MSNYPTKEEMEEAYSEYLNCFNTKNIPVKKKNSHVQDNLYN